MYTPILFVNLIDPIHWKINMVKHEKKLGLVVVNQSLGMVEIWPISGIGDSFWFGVYHIPLFTLKFHGWSWYVMMIFQWPYAFFQRKPSCWSCYCWSTCWKWCSKPYCCCWWRLCCWCLRIIEDENGERSVAIVTHPIPVWYWYILIPHSKPCFGIRSLQFLFSPY